MKNALSGNEPLHFEMTDVLKERSGWLARIYHLSHEM